MTPDKLPCVYILCMTYNHEKYIRETIFSFKQQNYQNIQFLIIDDCSPDNTYQIAINAAAGDDRITVLKNDFNLGAALNSKKIIDLSLPHADYIGFCEGDDYLINPERISKQVEHLEEHQNCSLVFTAANIIDEPGNLMHIEARGDQVKNFNPENTIFIGGNLCVTASTLYRRRVLENLPANFFKYPVGDYPLQIIASLNGKVAYLPIIGAAYRQASVSSWSKQMTNTDKYIANHEGTLKMLDELNILSKFRYSRYFSIVKLKYWYFLSLNKNLSSKYRIMYLLKKSGFYAPLIFITLFTPLFDATNNIRRKIRQSLSRRHFE